MMAGSSNDDSVTIRDLAVTDVRPVEDGFEVTQLAARLGCTFTEQDFIEGDEQQMTCAPGVYVAGDALRDVQLAIIAAAEGVRAAFAIHKALIREDLAERLPEARPEALVEAPIAALPHARPDAEAEAWAPAGGA